MNTASFLETVISILEPDYIFSILTSKWPISVGVPDLRAVDRYVCPVRSVTALD